MFLVVTFCFHLCSSSAFGAFTCPSSSSEIPSTDDIKIALKASEFTYQSNLTVGVNISDTNYTITYLKEDNSIGENQGFMVFVAEYGNTRVVTFRGTESLNQLVSQLINTILRYTGKEVVINNTGTSINTYFYNGFELLYYDLKPHLLDSTNKYIITGHSLGGAMASLLAIKLEADHPGTIWVHPQSSLVTFGQPRVGDQRYADLHDQMISPWRKFRFVLSRDPIPHIPLRPTWQHESREIFLESYREWWWWWWQKYWQVCPKQDSSSCSNKYYIITDTTDHLTSNYASYIDNLPSMFMNEGGNTKSSFVEAMATSC